MIDALMHLFSELHNEVFQAVSLPLVEMLGLHNFVEDAYPATEWFLIGCLQILLMIAVFAPLERLWPAEKITDRRAIRTDVFYTLLHRLGLFRLLMFFALDPVIDALDGELRFLGWSRLNVEEWWPGVTSIPLVSFLVYLLLFDFAAYWYHRLSHRFEWWWQLHAVHHSQRQMTMWSDNRNHLLDDMLRDAVFALLALAIGVEPSQFILLVVVSQLLESFQHANVRFGFGRIGERLIVSPRFHRIHHAVGFGHEMPGRPDVLGGCNFGVIFPWWDLLFRTADFRVATYPTGIRDQLPPPAGAGVDYGDGFWSQQWLAVLRLFGRGARAGDGAKVGSRV